MPSIQKVKAAEKTPPSAVQAPTPAAAAPSKKIVVAATATPAKRIQTTNQSNLRRPPFQHIPDQQKRNYSSLPTLPSLAGQMHQHFGIPPGYHQYAPPMTYYHPPQPNDGQPPTKRYNPSDSNLQQQHLFTPMQMNNSGPTNQNIVTESKVGNNMPTSKKKMKQTSIAISNSNTNNNNIPHSKNNHPCSWGHHCRHHKSPCSYTPVRCQGKNNPNANSNGCPNLVHHDCQTNFEWANSSIAIENGATYCPECYVLKAVDNGMNETTVREIISCKLDMNGLDNNKARSKESLTKFEKELESILAEIDTSKKTTIISPNNATKKAAGPRRERISSVESGDKRIEDAKSDDNLDDSDGDYSCNDIDMDVDYEPTNQQIAAVVDTYAELELAHESNNGAYSV